MDKKCKIKTKPGVSSEVTSDGSVVNKFSSPPTGTGNTLPVGYIFKIVFAFGDYCSVRRYIQSRGCFFPAAGVRRNNDGALYYVGAYGDYWSSSPADSNAYDIDFDSSFAEPGRSNDTRTYGYSVRCVKEFIPVFLPNQTKVRNHG
ncbi:MAG: fibrobacter succinogenes major paralogous domain-containing protein [Prevotella sp.]|jgi:hypothetical protein|nr:fibrobacter succinogenes major paralogous domain-containing protein [Prevotella sp.]